MKLRHLTVLALALSSTALAARRPLPPELPQGEPTSVDAPAPYRYLDWVPREDYRLLPPSVTPAGSGVCPGFYLPPHVVGKYAGRGDDSNQPIEAASDRYEMIGRDQIHLDGDVVIQQGSRLLESRQIDINTTTRQAHLAGDVRIRQQGMLMTGEQAELDMDSKRVDIRQAEYVIPRNHIRGSAERIHNSSDDVLVLDDSSYTTCAPGNADWRFTADQLNLDRESGWGTASNAVIRVDDVPVMYVPWIMFPIDDRRQSGFLIPTIGTNNSTGFDFSQPYYLNLAPNYDATITPRLMSRRGDAYVGEFRYLTEHTNGRVETTYLDSDQAFGDRTRYFNSWKQHSRWNQSWSGDVDYSRVSDPDYFLDLGNQLEFTAQTNLNQMAKTNYTTDHWNFGAMVQRFQPLDMPVGAVKLFPDPYRREPQLTATGFGLIGEDGFNWTMNTEAVRFVRPDNTLTRPEEGERLTLSPGLGYRAQTAWGYVAPRIRVVETRYQLTATQAASDDNPYIQTVITSVDSGLTFERDTTWLGENERQTLEPRLFLLYVPRQASQNAIPLFDTIGYSFSYDQLFRDNRFIGGDRYGDAQQASFGLTSRVIASDTGEEWLRMSVAQAFFFDERVVALSANTPPVETPRSAIANRINWQLDHRWSIYEEGEWDEANNNVDSISSGLQYRDKNNFYFNAGYIYHDKGSVGATPLDQALKQTDLSFIAPLTSHWSLLARWSYDEEQRRSIDNLVGVEYESCCWRVRLVDRRFLKVNVLAPDEIEAQQGVYLQFQLKGLGGTSNQVDTMLTGAIPGFQDREESYRNRF